MGLNLQYIDGQTPLEEEEKEGLLIPTIAIREELDEFEQQNIEEAVFWTLTRKLKAQDLFTEKFIKALHKRMYGNVWKWAGEFRKTNKNIGVDRWQIPTEVKNLLDDALFWIEHHTYPPEEIALRFKHRLVSIHCFANGNGRHSRLMADLIIEKIFGLPVFTWGSWGNLSKDGEARKQYLQAVKKGDLHDYTLLLKFART
ncbi:mobile mystery protein B [Chryseobacterium sp. MDT2-18]|uniref:mobile mystery protein B n=1 Tax=Chryseobacterium sp. MDT2-18 TaxID=1259136 RepID=UPI0027827A16|nr:mobile mystery protein B [Chryseobacterium sp. MDT2-18]MDQ0476464.1 Fic-DOC domain mobile mystery protein B [Chryseobacterium sp. MDT2-18]